MNPQNSKETDSVQGESRRQGIPVSSSQVEGSRSAENEVSLVGEALYGAGLDRPSKKATHRAPNSGIQLTDADAAIIKGMLIARDKDKVPVYRQSDIAAYFSINSGRLTEIKQGRKFGHVKPAVNGLPEPGPYVLVARLTHDNAVFARHVLDGLLEELSTIITNKRRQLERASNDA